MTEELPLVSCLCLTYARPATLRESIWCFLQQDYPNKELVVINDHPEPIYLDRLYPGVHVYNVPHRFGTLGEKRNFSFRVARSDYLFAWDDDDLSLPWRLSLTMRHLLATPDQWLFRPVTGWVSHDNQDYAIREYGSHNQTCYRRIAFDHAGGYTAMNSGQDWDFDSRIPADRFMWYPAPVHELFYVYRWGMDVHHISGLGYDQPGQPTGWERIAQLTAGSRGGGTITPGFDQDYWQDLVGAVYANPEIPPEEARLLAERLKPYHRLGPDRSHAGGEQP